MTAVRLSVAAAVTAAFDLAVVMVVALRRRVVLQPSREKGLHRLVDGTADAGDQLNARHR